jgi:hypothetical protein
MFALELMTKCMMNQHAHQSSRLLGHQTPDGRLSEQTPQDNGTGQRRGAAGWASSGPVAGRTPTKTDAVTIFGHWNGPLADGR